MDDGDYFAWGETYDEWNWSSWGGNLNCVKLCLNGPSGYLVTDPNGNTIFFPASFFTSSMMTSTAMVRSVAVGCVRSIRATPKDSMYSSTSEATSTQGTSSTVTMGVLAVQSQKNKVG